VDDRDVGRGNLGHVPVGVGSGKRVGNGMVLVGGMTKQMPLPSPGIPVVKHMQQSGKGPGHMAVVKW
jgi:hypothetical protein